jgi:hypothetical protein
VTSPNTLLVGHHCRRVPTPANRRLGLARGPAAARGPLEVTEAESATLPVRPATILGTARAVQARVVQARVVQARAIRALVHPCLEVEDPVVAQDPLGGRGRLGEIVVAAANHPLAGEVRLVEPTETLRRMRRSLRGSDTAAAEGLLREIAAANHRLVGEANLAAPTETRRRRGLDLAAAGVFHREIAVAAANHHRAGGVGLVEPTETLTETLTNPIQRIRRLDLVAVGASHHTLGGEVFQVAPAEKTKAHDQGAAAILLGEIAAEAANLPAHLNSTRRRGSLL